MGPSRCPRARYDRHQPLRDEALLFRHSQGIAQGRDIPHRHRQRGICHAAGEIPGHGEDREPVLVCAPVHTKGAARAARGGAPGARQSAGHARAAAFPEDDPHSRHEQTLGHRQESESWLHTIVSGGYPEALPERARGRPDRHCQAAGEGRDQEQHRVYRGTPG